jgi:ribosome-associated protein
VGKEDTINTNELPSSPDQAGGDQRSADRELALRIADVISDTPASNTLVLDIRGLSPFADFFVICQGENERQLRAILRTVTETLAEEGIRPERTEGTPAAGWILIDYGATIVHIFATDQRGFYRLEELWSEAPTLLAIQ